MKSLSKRLARAAATGVVGVGLLAWSASISAATTYNVNRTIGAGTVIGFIETDGTIGVLNSLNITNWVLTLSASNLVGGPTDTITFAGQVQTTVGGNALSATAANLLFDFDETGVFILQNFVGSSNFYCLESVSNCINVGTDSESFGFGVPTGLAQREDRTGQIIFASVRAPSVVPLPAALPLFGTGLGILGFLGWRRKRKVAAAG